MTGFDFTVIAILLLSMLLGLWRGLVCEALSLLGWPLAFVLSNLYADNLARFLPMPASSHVPVLSHVTEQQEAIRAAIAYVLVFVAVLVAVGLVIWVLAKLLKTIGVSHMDKAFGGLFGVLRGSLVVLALVWLAGITDIPGKAYWRGAMTSRTLEDVALLTKGWLPDSIAQRIRYRNRS